MFLDVDHLDKAMVWILVKFPGWLARSQNLSHPRLIGTGGAQESFHASFDFEGKVRLLFIPN